MRILETLNSIRRILYIAKHSPPFKSRPPHPPPLPLLVGEFKAGLIRMPQWFLFNKNLTKQIQDGAKPFASVKRRKIHGAIIILCTILNWRHFISMHFFYLICLQNWFYGGLRLEIKRCDYLLNIPVTYYHDQLSKKGCVFDTHILRSILPTCENNTETVSTTTLRYILIYTSLNSLS